MLRRSFFGIPAFALLQPPGAASTTTRAAGAWQAARHAQDDWLDANTAKHRIILDTWNPEHFPDALQFAGNIVETVAFDIPRYRVVDFGDGLFDALLGNIIEADGEAGDRADLGDPLAHLACADHSHFADFGAHPLTRTFATARIISNIALR